MYPVCLHCLSNPWHAFHIFSYIPREIGKLDLIVTAWWIKQNKIWKRAFQEYLQPRHVLISNFLSNFISFLLTRRVLGVLIWRASMKSQDHEISRQQTNSDIWYYSPHLKSFIHPFTKQLATRPVCSKRKSIYIPLPVKKEYRFRISRNTSKDMDIFSCIFLFNMVGILSLSPFQINKFPNGPPNSKMLLSLRSF